MAPLRVVALMAAVAAAAPLSSYYCGVDPDNPGPPVVPPLNASGLTMLQAHLVFRHGDRTYAGSSTTQCWPNDGAVWQCSLRESAIPNDTPQSGFASPDRLYRKVYDWHQINSECGDGQLTAKGLAQEEVHGAQLRAHFVDAWGLLGPTYDPSELFIHSDDEPRTVQSAQALVLGLFPPGSVSAGPGGALPVLDLHTVPVDLATEFPNAELCPGVDAIAQAAEQSPAFQAYVNNTAMPVIRAVEAALGAGISPDNFTTVVDCLMCHVCGAQPVPAGMSQALLDEAMRVASFLNIYPLTYPNASAAGRLNIGPLVNNIWTHMDWAVTQPAETWRLMLWSGHDSTVMPLLAALQVYAEAGDMWVPYASLVAIELLQDAAGALFVRVSANGQVLHPPGCGGADLCPLAAFAAVVEPLIPSPADCPGMLPPFPRAAAGKGAPASARAAARAARRRRWL